MAFTKIACVPKALASSPPVSKPVIVHPEVLKIGSPPEGSKDYEHWHSKDQEVCVCSYIRSLNILYRGYQLISMLLQSLMVSFVDQHDFNCEGEE